MVRPKNFILVLLAAGILSISFAPLSLWFAAPIAYAIYLKLLISGENQVRNSFLFALAANAVILSWSKTFVGVTPWILLSILQGLYLVPVGYLARYVKSPVVLIAAIIIADEAKNYFPFGGFGWSRIGYSQADSPLLNLVSIFGVTFLSLATLAISLLMLRPKLAHFSLVLLLLLAATIPLHQESEPQTLKVRAVQGGVPERGLSFNSRAQAVLDNHIERTLKDYSSSDQLILWPENAVDVDPLRNQLVKSKIEDLQRETNIPLLTGAILDGDNLSNSAVLFSQDGLPTTTYIKRYLTPFGEYIPLRNLASIISPHTDRVTDFTPGTQLVIHQVAGVKISTVICYEILSDKIILESAVNSGIIAVMTNSATFSGSAEGEQQLNITRIRAVETGRNVVSVSTTGPSAFINYKGEILQRLDDGEVASLSSTVAIRNGETMAMRYGGLFSLAVILLSSTLIAFTLVRRRSSS
jgi:apolipoprotein N-acyltransferase